MTFNLNIFTPFRLSRLANHMSRDLAFLYEKQYLISRTQWRIMAVLSSGEHTAQAIADKTVMDKSVISRAVKELIARQFVRRIASQTDGRAAPLQLTANGHRIANEIGRLVLAAEEEFLAELTASEKEQLDHILRTLQRRWHDDI